MNMVSVSPRIGRTSLVEAKNDVFSEYPEFAITREMLNRAKEYLAFPKKVAKRGETLFRERFGGGRRNIWTSVFRFFNWYAGDWNALSATAFYMDKLCSAIRALGGEASRQYRGASDYAGFEQFHIYDIDGSLASIMAELTWPGMKPEILDRRLRDGLLMVMEEGYDRHRVISDEFRKSCYDAECYMYDVEAMYVFNNVRNIDEEVDIAYRYFSQKRK